MEAGRHTSAPGAVGGGPGWSPERAEEPPAGTAAEPQPSEPGGGTEALADPVDAVEREARRPERSLASALGDRVRALLDEAERSGAEISHQAQQDAETLRREATLEAERIRSEATQRAREEVARASETLHTIIQHLEDREDELATLMGSITTEVERLRPVLVLLQGQAGDPDPAAEPEAPSALAAASDLEAASAPGAASGGNVAVEPDGPGGPPPANGPQAVSGPQAVPGPDAAAFPGAPVSPITGPDGGERRIADTEEARVLTLNMALNGTSREEADRYLEGFNVENRKELLDDFYGRVAQ